jgi:hypothetical protein
LAIAALAFLASPNGPLGVFWRPSPDLATPVGWQIPLLILLNASESLAFGLGIAFLIFGYPLVRAAAPSSPALALPAYLAIAWLLINWWPHDSLHVANGMNLWGLLRIEYGFHITLIIAAAVLARFFLTLLTNRGAARA